MYDLNSPLMSLGQVPAYAMQAWLKKHNPNVPGDLAAIIVNECSLAGLCSDIVCSQIVHETGWWTSYAAVQLHNPAGVGITNDLPQAQWPGFPSIQAGIHAQCAHLLTYVLGSGNPWRSDDPRYQAAVDAGYAGMVKTVGGLGGTWAVPGLTYGQSLVTLANDLVGSIGGGEMATDDPQAQWLPSVNFDAGRGGVTIDRIILHTTEGGYTGSLHWLQGPPASSNTNSSAHYIIPADGSTIAQLVREADTAWAAGVYAWNQRSINIEQEGYAGKGGFSDGLYQTTGELVGRIAARHNIPLDRAHVIGHMDVPPPNDHSDPGPHYDFDRVIAIASGGTAPAPPATDDNQFFPETGFYLSHGFLRFWQENGGLAIFGMPLSSEFTGAEGFTVQWLRALAVSISACHRPKQMGRGSRATGSGRPRQGQGTIS